MKYDPKHARSKPIDAGDYVGTLTDVKVTRSKKDVPMWVLSWSHQVGDKQFRRQDYIVNNDTCLWKMAKLAKAWGQYDRFKAGTFEIDEHLGDQVILVIGIRDSEEYGKQNTITGYKPVSSVSTPDWNGAHRPTPPPPPPMTDTRVEEAEKTEDPIPF